MQILDIGRHATQLHLHPDIYRPRTEKTTTFHNETVKWSDEETVKACAHDRITVHHPLAHLLPRSHPPDEPRDEPGRLPLRRFGQRSGLIESDQPPR